MGYAPANGNFRPRTVSLNDLTPRSPPATRKFVKPPRTKEQKLAEWTGLSNVIRTMLEYNDLSTEDLLRRLPGKYETDIKGALHLLGATSHRQKRGRPRWKLP